MANFLKNKITRTFFTRFPDEILGVYSFLQEKLNFMLNNNMYRKRLLSVDPTLMNGHFYKAIKEFDISGYKNWPLGCPSIYHRILLENIRRMYLSYYQRSVVAEIYLENNKEVDASFYDKLRKKVRGKFVSHQLIENTIRMIENGSKVELPRSKVLELDYSVAGDNTVIKKLGDNKFQLRLFGNEWLDYNIMLPLSLREQLTGKVANPKFIIGKKGPVGICSYVIETRENRDKNILGVDLGKIKQFSATVFNPVHKSFSEEIVNSKYIDRLYEKYKNLWNVRNELKTKIEIVEEYKKDDKFVSDDIKEKQIRRIVNLQAIKERQLNLKREFTKVVAVEIVNIALDNDCKEIKMENLNIFSDVSGLWNYGEIHHWVKTIGDLYSIKLTLVNPKNTSKEHPMTKEMGKLKAGRYVVFEDGTKLDRDYLGAMNISLRKNGKSKSLEAKKVRDKSTATPKRVKRKNTNKKLKRKILNRLNSKKEKTKIGIFSPLASLNNQTPWDLVDITQVEITKSSMVIKVHKVNNKP